MVQLEGGVANRPVSGAGVMDILEEEEQVGNGADSTLGPSPGAGHSW